tara:strand:- start:60 stop:374 length:315 start_codon:yes stop_codon:yes gene_type:complete
MAQVNFHICKHENPIQTVICNYTETSTMKAQNVNSFLRIDERERVSLNYHDSAITNMRTTKQLASKPLVVLRGVLLMTTQVNSSFLRTENKKQIAPFLRSEGVL